MALCVSAALERSTVIGKTSASLGDEVRGNALQKIATDIHHHHPHTRGYVCFCDGETQALRRACDDRYLSLQH